MAKSTKYAVLICIALSVILLIGIIVGLYFSNALIIIICMLPAVIYEVYRTEGKSTKWASSSMLLILILETMLLIFKINIDLAKYFELTGSYVGGYFVPFGDLRVLGPTIVAVISIILFVRTYGIYTKWLAIIIFAGAFTTIYILDPEIFKSLLGEGINRGI
ncbi:MAG: hypothetical protein ABH837_03410 [bacterium]